MFNNVMVGVDGLQGGRDAIDLARQLMAPDGRLTLAHVNGGYPSYARADSVEFIRAERQRSDVLLAQERRDSGVDADLISLGSYSAGRGLHRLAERSGADLLVVGSDHHGRIGRVLIGDETVAALTGAPCAVAVAPLRYASATRSLAKIGVGYDQSPESKHALGVARLLAERFGAELSAWHAIDMPLYRAASTVDAIRYLLDDTEAQLNELDGVEPHAVYGKPGEELGFYSESVDLLVIGSRGYGPLGRLFHGSTARALTQSCRSPLLVLTRAAREADSVVAGTDDPVLEGVAN